jgi:dihydrofolate synthase/folylpolyglutamate synthase
MQVLLERLGNPHLAYQTFHVAGTKGKGSTAAFLASILDSAGYRTGLYTSPHVSDPGERISVSIPPPEDITLTDLIAQIEDLIRSTPSTALPGSYQLTAFELVTLFALLYFRAQACQCAVIEAGIGGRYDATNIIQPSACLLTPVDLDHMEILGDTRESIARAKSGIIKPGIPVFCGFQTPGVKNIFREVSDSQHCPIRFLDEELETFLINTDITGTTCFLKLKKMQEQSFRLKLLGAFQAENAALAYLTIRDMLPHLNAQTMQEGVEKTFLPGRMELYRSTPPIVLDGAHTPFSIKSVLSSFDQIFPKHRILIFGAVLGKQIEAMAQILAPAFREIIISTPGYFKESDPEQVFRIFKGLHPETILEKKPSEALAKALQLSNKTDPILVTGSFFMISEIRKLL